MFYHVYWYLKNGWPYDIEVVLGLINLAIALGYEVLIVPCQVARVLGELIPLWDCGSWSSVYVIVQKRQQCRPT